MRKYFLNSNLGGSLLQMALPTLQMAVSIFQPVLRLTIVVSPRTPGNIRPPGSVSNTLVPIDLSKRADPSRPQFSPFDVPQLSKSILLRYARQIVNPALYKTTKFLPFFTSTPLQGFKSRAQLWVWKGTRFIDTVFLFTGKNQYWLTLLI